MSYNYQHYTWSAAVVTINDYLLTFDSLTGSWSVWPHVVTPQWLIKKNIYFLPIYIITLVEKKIIID